MIYHCTAYSHDPEEGEEPDIKMDVEADSPSQAVLQVTKQHGRVVNLHLDYENDGRKHRR